MPEVEFGSSPVQNGGIGDFFHLWAFDPGLASSFFKGEGGMGSLLYIYRSHLVFDLVGWVREVAFLLLFAINKLEMCLTPLYQMSETF